MTREPGGRCLIYDAILSSPLPLSPRKTSALFSICSRRGRIVGQLSFFQNVFTRFCELQFREIYTVGKGQSLFDYFFYIPHCDDRGLTRFQDISSFAKYLSFPTCGGEEEEIQRCVNWKGWLKCFAYKVNGEMERMQQKKKKKKENLYLATEVDN